jgi:hypothetical protein
MRRCLLFLGLSCCLLTGSATAQADSTAFPADWVGNWAGTLDIYAAAGKVQSIPMQLRIQPLDSGRYSYHIIYGPDEVEGLRPYVLEPVDPAQGVWRIDEQNSIAMEAYVRGAALYSRFEVMGTMLLCIVALEGETLRYEIVAGSTTPASVSGNATVDGEEIPEVKAYPVPTAQIAKLRRIGSTPRE